jgi:splicing factor 3B subunit 3
MSFQFVVDGDLCEQFSTMEPSKQREIASNLGHSPGVIVKKLEDLRTRYAF